LGREEKGWISTMYMKMLSGCSKKHLAVTGQRWDGAATLCGCSITRSHNWKLVMGLEGDECPECARRAFRFSQTEDRGPTASGAGDLHY
jgi:hypothetical protein